MRIQEVFRSGQDRLHWEFEDFIETRVLPKLNPYYLPLMPSSAITWMTMDPAIPLNQIPAIATGRLIREGENNYKKRMIPSGDVRKGILFANCESYEDMKKGIYRKVESLRGRKINDPLGPGFRTDNIFSAFSLVDRAMAKEVRRTGEPGFAHILRGASQCVDFIIENMIRYDKGEDVIPFTAETAELFLLLWVCHDLTEYKFYRDGKQKIQLGNIYSHRGLKQSETGIYLERLSDGKNVEEAVKLDIDPLYFEFFLTGIESLKSEGKDSYQQFRTLESLPRRLEYKLPMARLQDRMLIIIPKLGKIFDRLENLRAYTYLLPPDIREHLRTNPDEAITSPYDKRFEYQAEDAQAIARKALETIDFLYESEWYMLSVMADIYPKLRSFDSRTIMKMFLSMLYSSKFEAAIDLKVSKWRPTRIAFLMLLGCGPDLLFGNPSQEYLDSLSLKRHHDARKYMKNDWSIPGPWLPDPI